MIVIVMPEMINNFTAMVISLITMVIGSIIMVMPLLPVMVAITVMIASLLMVISYKFSVSLLDVLYMLYISKK